MQKIHYIPLSALLMLLLLASRPVYANDPFVHNDYALELLNRGEYEKALESLKWL